MAGDTSVRPGHPVQFEEGTNPGARPPPGSPEFEAAVQGSALPDSQSVSMGQPGWTQPGSPQSIDLRGTGKREEIQQVLREHGIDPDKKGQTIDASSVPGLTKALLTALFKSPL